MFLFEENWEETKHIHKQQTYVVAAFIIHRFICVVIFWKYIIILLNISSWILSCYCIIHVIHHTLTILYHIILYVWIHQYVSDNAFIWQHLITPLCCINTWRTTIIRLSIYYLSSTYILNYFINNEQCMLLQNVHWLLLLGHLFIAIHVI